MWHWHVEILLTLIIKLASNKILQTVHWIGAKNSQEIIIFLKQNTHCWIAWTYVIKQLVIFLHWFNYYFECLHVLWKSYDFVLNLENLSLLNFDKTDLWLIAIKNKFKLVSTRFSTWWISQISNNGQSVIYHFLWPLCFLE